MVASYLTPETPALISPCVRSTSPSTVCVTPSTTPSTPSTPKSVPERCPVAYRFNPYATTALDAVVVDEPPALPKGTAHTELAGRVAFKPTPRFTSPTGSQPTTPRADLDSFVRLFVGQLPYRAERQVVAWICSTFGGDAHVEHTERIMKNDPRRGYKRPTGCYYVYVPADCVTEVLAGMKRGLLVDDTGVWYASNETQRAILEEYCAKIKAEHEGKALRRPCGLVAGQIACPKSLQTTPSV